MYGTPPIKTIAKYLCWEPCKKKCINKAPLEKIILDAQQLFVKKNEY